MAFKRTPVAFASSARHYRRHGSAAVSPPPFSQNEKTDFLGVHIYHADGSRETVDYRKSEVMRMCSLQARDLIALEYSGYHRLPRPILLVRDSSIVVAIGCIRAIIQHNRIMLLHQNLSDSNRATQRVVEILRAIQKNAQRVAARDDDDLVIASEMVQGGSDEQPFECIALEAILDSMCRDHRNRESLLAPLVDSLLQQLSSRRVDPEVLQRLLPMKDSLSQFEIETTMFRDALSELMNNDEDMLEMLLSEKRRLAPGTLPSHEKHVAVELLLETYCAQMAEISQEAYYLRKKVDSTESIVELQLDAYRNHMLRISVQLALAAVAFSLSTSVAGVFGMNLVSGLEASPWAFAAVVGMSTGGMVGMYTHLNKKINDVVPWVTGPEHVPSIFNHLDKVQDVLVKAVGDESLSASTSSSSTSLAGSGRRARHARAELTISRDTFRKDLAALGVEASEEEVETVFDAFDVNRDGKLERKEVLQLREIAEREASMKIGEDGAGKI